MLKRSTSHRWRRLSSHRTGPVHTYIRLSTGLNRTLGDSRCPLITCLEMVGVDGGSVGNEGGVLMCLYGHPSPASASFCPSCEAPIPQSPWVAAPDPTHHVDREDYDGETQALKPLVISPRASAAPVELSSADSVDPSAIYLTTAASSETRVGVFRRSEWSPPKHAKRRRYARRVWVWLAGTVAFVAIAVVTILMAG